MLRVSQSKFRIEKGRKAAMEGRFPFVVAERLLHI